MTNRHALSHLTFAVAAATLILVTAGRAVELDPAAVAYLINRAVCEAAAHGQTGAPGTDDYCGDDVN